MKLPLPWTRRDLPEGTRPLRFRRVKSLKHSAQPVTSLARCIKLVTGVLERANPVQVKAGDLKTERYSRLLLDFREPIRVCAKFIGEKPAGYQPAARCSQNSSQRPLSWDNEGQ